jgi:VanZ family protein
LAYVPAAVWAALLLFVGGQSDVPTVETRLPLDKAAHFLLYGCLGVLVARGWQWSQRRPHIVLPLLLALTVGAVDELHQTTVAGRSSEFADWIADTAGVLVGCALVLRFVKDSRNAD